MSFIDPDDIEISPEAAERLREHLEESSDPEDIEEAIEEAEDSTDSEPSDSDIDDDDEYEFGGELSDDAEYYNSFGSYADALAFALDYPGVFVITYNDETQEYDVYRDYRNDDAAA